MKKLLLLLVASVPFTAAFAQQPVSTVPTADNDVQLAGSHQCSVLTPMGANKGAGLSVEYNLANDSQRVGTNFNLYSDYAEPLDSGLFYGTNALGYHGFAEHYFTDFDISGNNDTLTQITGFFSKWGGNAQTGTSSAKNVTLSVWKKGTNKIPVTGRTKFYVYGTPTGSPIATKVVAGNTLNINGTATITYLATPVNVSENVYVGYTMPYNWSPTDSLLGLRTTHVTLVNHATIEAGTGDTLVTANNLIQTSAGVWTSVAYTLGVTNGGNKIIAPLVKLNCASCGLSAGGFNANNLAFYGNYPNPVATTTTVKYAVKKVANVVITIYDNNGRTIRVMDLGNNTIGEHTAVITADGLAAGNYVYTLESSEGDIIASQMTVIK
ncbi:MAG: T9SS type A sorting domain-containing protein [Chitinophagaceae bacterium]